MDSPQFLVLLVKVKGKVDSSQEWANILGVAKMSLMGKLSSAIVQAADFLHGGTSL